jgi:prepilin-type N-terminal cleavage/methylation domain-containing protein
MIASTRRKRIGFGGVRIKARSAFTLIELLVVITIILLVSAVALPTVLPALNQRQVSEAARIVQAALVGARDAAIRNGQPSGIRLLPDPTFNGFASVTSGTGTSSTTSLAMSNTVPLAYNRIIPIDPAPEYSEGQVNIWGPIPQNVPYNGNTSVAYPQSNVLMIEEAVVNASTVVNNPTNWYWNIRVGDKIQINNAGPWYTVIGPLVVNEINGGNTELFVNAGPPGTAQTYFSRSIAVPNTSPAQSITVNPEFLFLVDGKDNNANGWVDEGWDGVDNDGDTLIDNLAEWEVEAWPGAVASGLVQTTKNHINNSYYAGLSYANYTIQRRPTPSPNAREISLPSSVVIDATTWNSTLERSRFPSSCFNPYSGFVDILLNSDGSLVPTTLFSSPASFPMAGAFVDLWLADRQDVVAPTSALSSATPPTLPIALGSGASSSTTSYSVLKGDYRLITLFSRTGQIVSDGNMPFFDSSGTYNVNLPFLSNQLGLTGTP